MRAPLFVMLLAVAMGAYAKPALENVSLQWRPTSDLKLGTMEMSQTPIQFEFLCVGEVRHFNLFGDRVPDLLD